MEKSQRDPIPGPNSLHYVSTHRRPLGAHKPMLCSYGRRLRETGAKNQCQNHAQCHAVHNSLCHDQGRIEVQGRTAVTTVGPSNAWCQQLSSASRPPSRHSSKEILPRDFLAGKELLPSKFYPAKSFNPASSTQQGAFTQQDRSFYPASAYPASSTQQVLGQQTASTLQVLPSKELISARSLSQQVLTQQRV